MSKRDAPRFTAAYWRDKSDEELEDALRGGPMGNKTVEGAYAEIKRRSGERQEKWAKRGFWAAVAAAVAAVAGAIITLLK